MARRNSGGDEAIMGLFALVVMVIIALPFVAIYLLGSNESDKKVLGVVLLIVGVILWIAMMA